MAIRLTVDVIIDVDEWDEDEVTRLPLAVRTIMETYSQRIADAMTDAGTGCDLYGARPVYRADGEAIGWWRVNAGRLTANGPE